MPPGQSCVLLLNSEATRKNVRIAAPDVRREGEVDVKHPVSEQEAGAWLEDFKRAVEDRDIAALSSLFTPDCDLQGRQYMTSVHGHAALERHWRDCVFEHQRDNSLSYEIWATRDDACFVRWRASYTWLPINGFVELDGVFRLSFVRGENAKLVCRELQEWVDYREVG